jgi:ferrous iron transport protein A
MSQNGSTNGHAATPLGHAPRGFRGRIQAISVGSDDSSLPDGELERRLIELGFIEGARVEILHEGAIGRDPIAVRINHATVALRRREAMSILVNGDSGELNG